MIFSLHNKCICSIIWIFKNALVFIFYSIFNWRNTSFTISGDWIPFVAENKLYISTNKWKAGLVTNLTYFYQAQNVCRWIPIISYSQTVHVTVLAGILYSGSAGLFLCYWRIISQLIFFLIGTFRQKMILHLKNLE